MNAATGTGAALRITGSEATARATTLPCVAILGRLGTPQLACLRSWRRQGLRCVFLHADAAPLPRLVQALLGVPCVHLGPLRLDDDAFVASLARALAQAGVQALTCVSEPISEALWARRAELPAGLQIVSVQPHQSATLASKWRQDGLARAAGLDTLPTWCLGPGERAELPAEAYPAVVRPDEARRTLPAFKVEVVQNAAELQRLVDRLQPGSAGVVVQPLVHGPNLLVHAWRSADGRCAGHAAFRVDLKHQGLSVVMRPVQAPPEVLAGCTRMALALGLTGVFHFDFIEDARTGRLCFLDLNPRLGGSTGKALAAGYDEPLALLATLAPSALPGAPFLRPTLRSAGGKHQALRALVSVLRGRSTAADYPCPARGRAVAGLLQFLLAGRDEIVNLAGWRSALAFALYQLRRRLAAPADGMPPRPSP